MNGTIFYSIGACALGHVLVASTAKGICAILLGDSADELSDELQKRHPRATLARRDACDEAHLDDVTRYLADPTSAGALPVDLQGTEFQRRVWGALQQIPRGTTISYTELASRIGAPQAARAVAGACAANPLAVVVPCHRVVRQDGQLSGFRWGVQRKRALLDLERS